MKDVQEQSSEKKNDSGLESAYSDNIIDDASGVSSREDFFENYGFKIILALRKITHAIDTHSKKLAARYQITGPQLLCLYTIAKEEEITLSKISKLNCLSVSTVNGIIDRLEKKDLIVRQRDTIDKRKVFLKPTAEGRKLALNAPLLLNDKLAKEICKLPELEQATIALSLDRIVNMMLQD